MVATTDPSAPLFVVVGATGAQGGSVISHLLASKMPYRIRGLTRDPSKPAAQALVAKGAEVVKADVSSPAEVNTAFEGANYVFTSDTTLDGALAVTNFWEHGSAEKELADGKVLVDGAVAAGAQLLVWSGVESATKVSGGKHTQLSHFDSKANVTKHAQSTGIPLLVVQPGFYLSNFTTMQIPRKQNDGTFLLALPAAPSTLLPVLDTARDYGAYVVEGVESPNFGAGTEVLASSEYISIKDVVAQWSEVSGKTIVHKEVSDSAFAESVPQGGEELSDMFRFFQNFGYYGGKDIAPSQKGLSSHVVGFKEFAEAQDWRKILV